MSSEKEKAVRLYRTISLIVAFSLVAISVLLLVLEKPANQSSINLILVLTATALFSGAVTAIVFNSLSLQESDQQLNLALERVLREVFRPLRSTIEDTAISGYRWNTHIIAPQPADPFPDYAIQLIRFGYTRKTLPETARIVCLASMDDDALAPFQDPDRYLMRWQVDDTLDPSDPNVFTPLALKVDDRQIDPKIHSKEIPGTSTKVCEYHYRIPREIRHRERNRIEVTVSTRKYFADTQITFKTILFATVTDAEFSCTVDSSIKCRQLSVAANTSGLGPRGELSIGQTYPGPGPYGAVAAHARYAYPLQAGTSVTFYVDRERLNKP
jgi:hypothetical protein